MNRTIESRQKAQMAEPWDFDVRFPMPLPEAPPLPLVVMA